VRSVFGGGAGPAGGSAVGSGAGLRPGSAVAFGSRFGSAATALAVVYVALWASAYVPSKVGASSAPPFWFLVARFLTAGGLMLLIALGLRRPFPRRRRDWLRFGAMGVLANAAYLGLTYTALGRGLAAGIGSIVASTNPLVLALVAPWLLREPLSARKALGMALGFAGVVWVMVARTGTGTAGPIEVGLAFLGVVCNVGATVVFARARGSGDLLAVNTLQLLAAGLALVPVAALAEGAPAVQPTTPLVTSFWYLVLALSVGASLVWFWLLSRGAASRVSAFYFLTPVFGVVFGALLLHETVLPSDAVGLASIVAGIALVQRG
jgi:drug/metabolite transporter (DMT)-like permease